MAPAHKCYKEAKYKKLWPPSLGHSMGPIEGTIGRLWWTPQKIIFFTGRLCFFTVGFKFRDLSAFVHFIDIWLTLKPNIVAKPASLFKDWFFLFHSILIFLSYLNVYIHFCTYLSVLDWSASGHKDKSSYSKHHFPVHQVSNKLSSGAG